MSLIVGPATRENLAKTVESSVENSLAEKYLSADLMGEIRKYAGLEGIRCWAMTKSSQAVYDKIRNGDEVLLSENKTGKFTHYGVVIGKTHNETFGNALWSIINNHPWENIFFLANVRRVDILKSDFVRRLGYNEGYLVPGVLMVNEKGYQKIGTVSRELGISVADNVAEANVTRNFSGENAPASGTRRIGHSKFSVDIKGLYNYRCSICGITEVEFLVGAHISRWSEDPANRLNPQNGICLCAFHDRAFEFGYIGLDEDFRVLLHSKIDKRLPLYGQLFGIAGKRISLPPRNQPDKNLLKLHRKRHNLGEYGN